jgi:hypothetical protein
MQFELRRRLRFPTGLGQLLVRFLREAEIVGALDGHFLFDIDDLANDVEIVLLGFFVHYAVARKGADNVVVGAFRKLLL